MVRVIESVWMYRECVIIVLGCVYGVNEAGVGCARAGEPVGVGVYAYAWVMG